MKLLRQMKNELKRAKNNEPGARQFVITNILFWPLQLVFYVVFAIIPAMIEFLWDTITGENRAHKPKMSPKQKK